MNLKITGTRADIDKTLEYLSINWTVTSVKYVNDFSGKVCCFAELVLNSKKKEVIL